MVCPHSYVDFRHRVKDYQPTIHAAKEDNKKRRTLSEIYMAPWRRGEGQEMLRKVGAWEDGGGS